MGTPEFAVASLRALLKNHLKVVAVITAPDKPAGRGQKLRQSAVKEYAQSRNLPVLQPTNLKSENFLEELKKYKADLQVVVAFRMLPKAVWAMPKYGTFNLHASLLPQYRGAAPINWAIINGETVTGVTTFFIDEQIDNGALLLQKETPVHPDQTFGELHNILMDLGGDLVVETIRRIADNSIQSTIQPAGNFKPAPKLSPQNCEIKWTDTVHNVYNLIRGLSPVPAAHTKLFNDNTVYQVKILEARPFEEEHTFTPGMVKTTKKEIKVYCADGYMDIIQLKLSGKALMDAQSLLNGFSISQDATMN